MADTLTALRVATSQESLSCRLMDELRAVCLKDEYDWLQISTIVGVLEMVKLEMLETNK